MIESTHGELLPVYYVALSYRLLWLFVWRLYSVENSGFEYHGVHGSGITLHTCALLQLSYQSTLQLLSIANFLFRYISITRKLWTANVAAACINHQPHQPSV